MASRRVGGILGAVAVAGGGYYLYTAGGDPKVAKKEMERMRRNSSKIEKLQWLTGVLDDATSAANRIKGNDYSSKEAQKQGEEWAQKAGSKIDQTVS